MGGREPIDHKTKLHECQCTAHAHDLLNLQTNHKPTDLLLVIHRMDARPPVQQNARHAVVATLGREQERGRARGGVAGLWWVRGVMWCVLVVRVCGAWTWHREVVDTVGKEAYMGRCHVGGMYWPTCSKLP